MTDMLLVPASTSDRRGPILAPAPVAVIEDGLEVEVGVEAFSHPLAGRGLIIKRALDIVIATAAIVVLLPVILLVLIAVRIESPGAALFKQQRVGLNNRKFWMYKVRSMRADAAAHHHHHLSIRRLAHSDDPHNFAVKLTGDSRVTRVGRFIRRCSIDELPQLWNVLKGDMSLVGPRPALPEEVELYDDVARRRHLVHPGMTGPWQVSGRCELTFKHMIDLDLAYARDWTPLRDIVILAKTPFAAVCGRGAR